MRTLGLLSRRGGRGVAWLCAFAVLGCATQPASFGAGPALWQARAGRATVYLLGTTHVLSRPVPWLTPRIAQAFSESRELWLEGDLSDQGGMMRAVAGRAVDPDYDLSAAFSPQRWAQLSQALTACGIKPAQTTHVRPWFVMLVFVACAAHQRAVVVGHGSTTVAQTPDMMLVGLAAGTGKPVHALETWGQQIGAMADLPDGVYLDLLRRPATAAPRPAPNATEVDEHAWAVGEVASMERDLIAPFRRDQSAMYRSLLEVRDARFADGVSGILQRPVVAFVAVGVGHLIGPDNVLDQLRARGVAVSRIE